MRNSPLVLNENQAVAFKFWLDAQLQDGLRYQNGLFQHVQTFPSNQKRLAYDAGRKIAAKGIFVLVTHSKQQYRVWRDLRPSAQ